jgi:tetratricopeptide (TPR) repeat protein
MSQTMQNNQVSHNDALALARKYHQTGNLTLASQVYKDILKVIPDDFGSLHYMSIICYQLGEFEEGLEYIEKAVEIRDDHAESWNAYGAILAALKQNEKAIEQWKKAVKLKPDFAGAYSNMGNAYWELNDFKNAQKACEKAVKYAPEDTGGLINLGNALASQGKHKEAIKLWEKAHEINPYNAGALVNIGNAYKELGQIQKSLEVCEKAYEMEPENPIASLNLANAKRELGLAIEAEELYRKSAGLRPDNPKAHANLALSLIDQNKLDEAIVSLRYALTFDPENSDVLSNLTLALTETHQLKEAEKLARKALKLNPDSPEAKIDLADVLFKLNRFDEAETLMENAFEELPDDGRPYLKYATVLESLNRVDDALEYIYKAKEKNPESLEIMHKIASVLYMADRAHEALEMLDQIFEINPKYPPAIATKSEILVSIGDTEQAKELAEQAIKENPNIPNLYFTIAKLKKFTKDDPHFKQMQALANKIEKHGYIHAAGLNFGLFKAYEDLEDYEKAFEHLKKGNDIKFATLPYDVEQQATTYKKVKEIWSTETLDKYSGKGCEDETPIFIVGMPRSGTTLTEQIISSHPEVYGAGELYHLGNIEKEFGFINENVFKPIGEKYVEMARNISEESKKARFITDKMPGNYAKMGLISLALPNAKIIHTRRSPMDTCLSCYKQLFARGHEWSYNLEKMANHYHLYMDLMAYWREHLGDRFIEINYEDTVTDFENQARKLIDYVGLEWDDACLEPHKQKRTVLTASKAQVIKPVYKSSVSGWKRYEKQLEPLAKELEKFTDKDGRQKPL